MVLAAGLSRRMGFDKVFEPLEGLSPLARVVQALENRTYSIVVCSADLERAQTLAPAAQAIVVNDSPERGMVHSLRLALDRIPSDRTTGVLLADMPFVASAHIDTVETLMDDGIDVAFPLDDSGRPGHPVLFAAAARPILYALPDGDTLREARDDRRLRQATTVIADRRAFDDLDLPADWHRSSPIHP